MTVISMMQVFTNMNESEKREIDMMRCMAINDNLTHYQYILETLSNQEGLNSQFYRGRVALNYEAMAFWRLIKFVKLGIL